MMLPAAVSALTSLAGRRRGQRASNTRGVHSTTVELVSPHHAKSEFLMTDLSWQLICSFGPQCSSISHDCASCGTVHLCNRLILFHSIRHSLYVRSFRCSVSFTSAQRSHRLSDLGRSGLNIIYLTACNGHITTICALWCLVNVLF